MKISTTGSSIYAGGTMRMQTVDDFIAFIREANEILQNEVDLSPNNQRVANITQRLSLQLRSSYQEEEVQAVLSDEYIRRNRRSLQDKLSEAEFLAELSDSRQIGQSKGSALELVARLPVWNTYMALVGEELSVMRRLIRQNGQMAKSPIVFVGSGPMPLSPIIFHLFGDVEVICLEMDSKAYDASCCLLEQMGLGSNVTVLLKNGAEFDYSSYNRIFVASLVRNKRAVLEQISRTSSTPLAAVRTAEGMNQIMYEAIDESQLQQQGWSIAARTWPDKKLVINSTLFLERAAAE